MVRVFSGGVGGDTRAQSWLAVSGCGEVQTMCIERCMGAAGLKVRGQPQWQTRSGEAPPVDRPLPCAISICPRRRVESAHGNAGPPRLARRRPSHHAASFGSDTTSPHVSRRRAARRAPRAADVAAGAVVAAAAASTGGAAARGAATAAAWAAAPLPAGAHCRRRDWRSLGAAAGAEWKGGRHHDERRPAHVLLRRQGR